MAKKKASGQDRAFLDEVAAHPEDDSPRLVYADWLEDQGQTHRAEFIRLQCRLASMDEDDPERLDLELREDDLLFVYRYQWPALPAWVGLMLHNDFRRGFLDRTSMTAADLLKRGHTVFAAAPITDLEIRAVRDKMPQVAACPLLARLTALRFEEHSITPQAQLTPKDLRELAASPHLSALRALELPAVTLSDAHVKALAGWPLLPQLRRLELCPESAKVFETLARPGRLASLERLTYRGPYSAAGFRALADAAPALTHLSLSSESNDSAGLAALARSLPVTSLRIRGGRIEALAEPPLAERLSLLELEYVTLSQEAVASLAPRLARLRRFSLAETSLGTAGAGALAAGALNALTRLDLRKARLDAEAARLLAHSPRLAGLRSLDLSRNTIGDEGAIALASSPHLTGLMSLNLTECAIEARGATALAASPNLAGLRSLCLRYNPIGDEGMRALARSPHLSKLHVLNLDGTQASAEGVRELALAQGLGSLRRLRVTAIGTKPQELAQEFADPARLPRLLELDLAYDPRYASLSAIGRPVVL